MITRKRRKVAVKETTLKKTSGALYLIKKMATEMMAIKNLEKEDSRREKVEKGRKGKENKLEGKFPSH